MFSRKYLQFFKNSFFLKHPRGLLLDLKEYDY